MKETSGSHFHHETTCSRSIFDHLAVRVACYALAALLMAAGAGFPLPDDGVRHIAFARDGATMGSWGQVFPHSLFFTDYDPWSAWHRLLEFVGARTGFNIVHLAVNAVVLFLLMTFLDRLLTADSRARLASLGPIAVIFIAGGSAKMVNLRPDSLSCLYAALALGLGNGFVGSALAAMVYAPFYYLFFFYTGAIFLCQAVTGKGRAAAGTLGGSIVGLWWHLGGNGHRYLETVKNLFLYPEAGNIVITEQQALLPFLDAIPPAITGPFLALAGLGLAYRYRDYASARPLAAFILITMPLWARMTRYFSLLTPLFKVFILQVVIDGHWRRPIEGTRKVIAKLVELFGAFKDRPAFGIPAIVAAIVVTSANLGQWDRSGDLRDAASFASPRYNGATILFNALPNSLYYALYHNSSIRTVPSCSIGWFEKKDLVLAGIYERLIGNEPVTEKEISTLARAVGANFYFHTRLSPKQPIDFKKMRAAGLVPIEVVGKALVFEVIR